MQAWVSRHALGKGLACADVRGLQVQTWENRLALGKGFTSAGLGE